MATAITERWWKRDSAWIGSPLFNWLLCWVVLPNAAFCGMWLIGGPPRHPAIIGAGAIGLIVRASSFWVRFAGFTLALVYSTLDYISSMFNLALTSLIPSIGFMLELQPSASIEYVALGAALAATLAAAYRLLRLPANIDGTRAVAIACAVLLTTAATDHWMSKGMRGSYKRIAPAGAEFSSATGQTRLAELATGRNHVMVVMVEAMGLPRDPELRRKQFQRLLQPGVARLYTVETGTTPYYGSTTGGEIRELCGRWGDYPEFEEMERDTSCLPAQLARKGYRTAAYHSFDGAFFDRTYWYPKVGFQQARFREGLVADGAGVCPGVFPGACDRDVPAILHQRLRRAKSPQFLYWLTLNSHLPVPNDAALQTDACRDYDFRLAKEHPMICRLFRLWDDIDQGIARIALDPALPPTDILIVGDHMPPFFDRESRAEFDPERVPWILLRRKPAEAPAPVQLAAKR